MWFNLDFSKIVVQLLPYYLRSNVLIEIMKLFAAQLTSIKTSLANYRTSTAYFTLFDGQVIYLEKLLNDQFTTGSNALIFISDIPRSDKIYLYTAAENQPVYLYTEAENLPVYLYTASEQFTHSFIINIPTTTYSTLTANSNNKLNLLKAYVDKYKVAGFTYIIQTF